MMPALAVLGFNVANAMEIKVRCDQNQDLVAAIRRAADANRRSTSSPRAQDVELIVDISGTCNLQEQIRVRGRDGWERFTLRSDGPETAVLQGNVSYPDPEALVFVKDLDFVRVENLRFPGPSRRAMSVVEVGQAQIDKVTVDRPIDGLLVESGSAVAMTNSSLTAATIVDSAFSAMGSRLESVRPLYASGSTITLTGTEVRGNDTALLASSSVVSLLDGSSIVAHIRAVGLFRSSTLEASCFNGCAIEGRIEASTRSHVSLSGADAHPAGDFGGILLNVFSTAAISGQLTGDIECYSGSDAVVAPNAVDGTISGCPSAIPPSLPGASVQP